MEKIWEALELRLVVLLSLSLQVVLIFSGNRRKYTKNKLVAATLWLCYLAADYVATFALGILSRARYADATPADQKRHAIAVFWAPFLLLHLGGPDTITAYAMADNELWSRHLLTLICQVSIAVYVYIASFTPTSLNFVWPVIFFAGFIKFGERSWVLYSASRDRRCASLVSRPDPGPNHHEDSENNTQESIPLLGDPILAKASFFLETVKKVFAGLNLSFEERQVSISYFENLSWEDAFKIVEIELGLVYDLFYTKSSFVFSRAGVILRVLTCSSTIAAFVAFLFIQEGYPQTEVIVTYVLLLGAIVLEMYAILLLVLSERMVIRFGWDLREDISWLYRSRLVPARKRWSESMGQYNVIGRCLKYTPKRDVKFKYCPEMICRFIGGVKHHIETFHQYLDMKFRWKSMPVEDRLKELIYKKIKAIAEENKSGGTEIRWKKRASHIGKEDEMEFTHCVLLWHMATDIFYQKYQTTESASVEIITKRENCILLSNYMVHLLITSPVLLPRGTGHIFFKDVCARTTEFFDNQTGLCARDACEKLSSLEFENTMEGDRSKFFLKVVCKLAARLEIKGDDEAKWDDEATWDDEAPWDDEAKWERVTEVWIYMLFVAAAQCSWSDHADKLNQGGELLTHVWLLMAHFGVADLFRTSKTSFKGQMALV